MARAAAPDELGIQPVGRSPNSNERGESREYSHANGPISLFSIDRPPAGPTLPGSYP
jgi:hypothetical protein